MGSLVLPGVVDDSQQMEKNKDEEDGTKSYPLRDKGYDRPRWLR